MMKKIFQLIFLLASANISVAQVSLPAYSDSLFSTYYHQRVTHFKSLPHTSGDIIFVGNSITDGAEWSELFNNINIKNRGISGDVSAGVLNRLNEITDRKPTKIFLMIGVNDLARNVSVDSLINNIKLAAIYIRQQTPGTKLYIQSILPVNDVYEKFGGHTNKGEMIRQVNLLLAQNASTLHYTYIDLYTRFTDVSGKLNAQLTNDGLHLKGEAYLLWKHLVFPYVADLNARPALIPLPQFVQWNAGAFQLYACHTIVIKDKALQQQAEKLQQYLRAKGLNINVTDKPVAGASTITLSLAKVNAPLFADEAYELKVNASGVSIAANTKHGIFNATQTLMQLLRDDVMIDYCEIRDWPAFSWRGYMLDVGRNFISMEALKQQIDVMGRYKLNVFHFHPTEDIAWRIAIKKYPQLTAPENMLRNKGLYYTEQDIKELIAYCKERHITFVPEIDMPGHSAAFKRAMKVDMQSDSGMVILKNILKEICDTYDLQYIHIGADEVKITNQNFIPEMTAFIEGLGKKIIGWQPGGNFTGSTIRQLWMDDNGKVTGNNKFSYIDSRHLYLNHMDPLESVVTIFNRQIDNKNAGDAYALGGTICMWHDRALAREEDLFRMNPVYPAMLTFAERSWRGGGTKGWIANIDEGDKESFAKFEARLLDNKKLYFDDKPFTYVKQSNIVWQLIGPYDNGGDADKKFAPELFPGDSTKWPSTKTATGGTIVLRHWWAPLIKGAIDDAKENTTWYATTRIWSDEEAEKNFWIGFNNLSRSPATDSPPESSWDNKASNVWVNGRLIESPHWKRGGQKGNPEIPLIDEGYEYREATKIQFHKGWNDVLIKTPVGSFKGKDWQNPSKWQFTFVPVGD